jgi:hypothetical protein
MRDAIVDSLPASLADELLQLREGRGASRRPGPTGPCGPGAI